MIEVIPANMVEKFNKYALDGVFAIREIYLWKAQLSYTMKGRQKIKFISSKKLDKFDLKRKDLLRRINTLFVFSTYKTVFGYYIPSCNVERYRREIYQIKIDIENYTKYILSNFDELSKEMKRGCVELAQFKWNNELKNPGFPPELFIEQFSKDYIERSKKRLEANLQFDMFPVSPFIDDSKVLYGNSEEIAKINAAIGVHLYNSVIEKRTNLVRYLLVKAREESIRYKSICTFLKLWKAGIFYDDIGLVEKIDAIRDGIIKSVKRDKNETVKLIYNLVEYISNHEDYLVAFTLKKG